MTLEARLKRLEAQHTEFTSYNDSIPFEPEAFYDAFGHVTHPSTGQPVERLADYQYRTWRLFQQYRRLLEIKSNKIGETTKWLMCDFQLAILPTSHPFSCRGYDQLVIAQTKDHAKEHLRDLRKMIIDSAKYSKYLINKPDEITVDAKDINKILKDEQSKTGVIYVHNPERPTRPSRIIALGIENHGAILSWKRVKHWHMSDVTAAEGDYSRGIHAAMTRLANTNGTAIIETVPGMPLGEVYDMWERARNEPWKEGDFMLSEVTAEEGVKANIITQQFLDGERRRLGPRYGQYYMAQFGVQIGGVFTKEQIERCMAHKYDPDTYHPTLHIMSADSGYGSSKFSFIVTRHLDNMIQVVFNEEYERSDDATMVKTAADLMTRFKASKFYIDGSNPEYIRAVKKLVGEELNYLDVIKRCDRDNVRYQKIMRIVPVFFNKENAEMLSHAHALVSEDRVAIHPKFKDLLRQMRLGKTNEKGALEKKEEMGQTWDSLDSFFLNLKGYKKRGET